MICSNNLVVTKYNLVKRNREKQWITYLRDLCEWIAELRTKKDDKKTKVIENNEKSCEKK